MELRLLDCLKQICLFQRDVVFPKADELFPFRQIKVHVFSPVLVSLPSVN